MTRTDADAFWHESARVKVHSPLYNVQPGFIQLIGTANPVGHTIRLNVVFILSIVKVRLNLLVRYVSKLL